MTNDVLNWKWNNQTKSHLFQQLQVQIQQASTQFQDTALIQRKLDIQK